MDWLWNSLLHFLVNGLAGLPGWILLLVGGVLLGVAFKFFGWQGVAGGLVALLTLGAYRQGWKDRGDGKPAFVPIDLAPPPTPPPKVKRRETISDLFKGLRRK